MTRAAIAALLLTGCLKTAPLPSFDVAPEPDTQQAPLTDTADTADTAEPDEPDEPDVAADPGPDLSDAAGGSEASDGASDAGPAAIDANTYIPDGLEETDIAIGPCQPEWETVCLDRAIGCLDDDGEIVGVIGVCVPGMDCVVTEAGPACQCLPERYSQCGEDGHVHHVDSCGVEHGVAVECPADLALCINDSEKQAHCECLDPAADPAFGCQGCAPGQFGPDCDECRRFMVPGGDGDGLSWADAAGSLTVVLAGIPDACAVWIAAGRYELGAGGNGHSLDPSAGGAMIGGFAGGETTLDERPPDGPPTVIAGATDAVLPMVYTEGETLLDRITFTGASEGVLVVFDGGPLTVRDCVFVDNDATELPGAIYSENSTLVVEGSVFVGNRSTSIGAGAIEALGGALTITRSRFVANRAHGIAAAVSTWGGGAPAHLSNVLFAGQLANSEDDAAIYTFDANLDVVSATFVEPNVRAVASYGSSTILFDCAFAHDDGADFDNDFGTTTVTWSALEGAPSGTGTVAVDGAFAGYPTPAVTGSWSEVSYDPTSHRTLLKLDAPTLTPGAHAGQTLEPGPAADWGLVADNGADWVELYGDITVFVAPGHAFALHDLRPGPGSPLVDAGYGTGAPPHDIDGTPRHDDLGVDDAGAGDPTYVDLGAWERDPSAP